MFDSDKRTFAKLAPKLRRVLIADPQPNTARMLSELLRDIANPQVWVAPTTERALKAAETCDPQLIVVELGEGKVDGLAFTKTLRRSQFACRKAPVIAVTGSATAALILAARDAGVHEFLRRPYSLKDLVRRLEVVTLKDRDWVEAMGYIGPDRRRFNSGEYAGPLKRRSDGSETPYQQKLNQSLKIIRAAAAQCEADPPQAVRAMMTQVTAIQAIATDLQLTLAAAELQRQLGKAAQPGAKLTRAEAEAWAKPLLAFLPKDAPKARSAAAA